ncbi:MAG: chromate transporter, partial [Gammaproteobacteria bacterium]|nr:chromate transporter [Gammaproteobacteria bacterium]
GGRSTAPALIDDDSPAPEHARFRWSRLLSFVAIGLGLWAAVLGFLLMSYGWHGTLTQMGWFFTKAALVTFGGAYAVLPYVYQGGVEHYGWLTAAQMIDGLALGETTPGPLIMVVAFVGFVGGWTQQIFGPELLPWAGIAGACVATLFTFLPSFLFILVGGPAVEASRHEVAFTAPLAGITAAVVGVIVNLALFFAWHVLWPRGVEGGFDVFAAILCLAAFLALSRYPVGVVPVIAACAAAGVLRHLIL